MYLTEAITIKLKCSDFMLKSEHCNDDTVFAVFDSSLRTHDFYLILSFIYSKYKDSISNKKYLTEIENYIKLFNTDSDIDSDYIYSTGYQRLQIMDTYRSGKVTAG